MNTLAIKAAARTEESHMDQQATATWLEREHDPREAAGLFSQEARWIRVCRMARATGNHALWLEAQAGLREVQVLILENAQEDLIHAEQREAVSAAN